MATIDYKEKYDEALKVAQETYETQPMYREWLEKMFPELAKTKDKEIYQAISVGLTDVFNEFGWSDFGGIPIEEIQDWLDTIWQKDRIQTQPKQKWNGTEIAPPIDSDVCG